MKNVVCVLVFALVACVLSGCTYRAGITISDGKLEGIPTKISLGTEYLLNRKAPYEMSYTDSGVDVIIHFLIKDHEE